MVVSRRSINDIATRDALRLAAVLREVGGEGRQLNSGWMACDAPDSWADYAAGLGVGHPVSDDELDELIAFYRDRGRPAKVQITPYQHPSLLKGLSMRGFTPYALQTILVCELSDVDASIAEVEGLSVRRLDPASQDDVEAFVRAQSAGFYPDSGAPESVKTAARRVAKNHRTQIWLLEVSGELAGSGGIETYENCAVLIAGAVIPPFRRRGIQRAFMAFRLGEAASTGLDYALVGSTPGGPTERNALRLGFTGAYTQLGLSLSW